MDEGDTKTCQNCKREIPAVNFTIHTVHCARNIKVCPVCKEPVPQAELEEHHEKLHKLLPCKQCGESVCGTDLEDHIRDSCANTIKSCRFCELELPRRDLPAHEGYCGVRTEQCPECREWVMIKYRQLHLDSNHGFLRLNDDPVPQPRKETPKPLPKVANTPKPINLPSPSTSNGTKLTTSKITNLTTDQPRTVIRYLDTASNDGGPSYSGATSDSSTSNIVRNPMQNVFNGAIGSKVQVKRTNDQPQINTTVEATSKVNKDLSISRGAVKKRPAPKPPTRAPPCVDPKRECAYNSALKRQQQEDRSRQEQTAYNLSVGLPPVLSPAAKLEKLRKMDALQNRELETLEFKNKLQGRVWMDTNIPTGHALGSQNEDARPQTNNLEVNRRRIENRAHSSRTPNAQEFGEDRRNDLRDLKPMSPQEFMDRFKELQIREDTRREGSGRSERVGDRFSEIKSSLRELRRGLNEVTAPYNSTYSNTTSNNSERARRSGDSSPVAEGDEGDVALPCEFCGLAVPAGRLVLHQTGCRPDLAQFRQRPQRSPARAPLPPPPPPQSEPYEEPVIPCEFCTESLPVYLITEHQTRCSRDQNLMYPD